MANLIDSGHQQWKKAGAGLVESYRFFFCLRLFSSFDYHFVQFVHAFVKPLSDDGTGRLDVVCSGRRKLLERQLLLYIRHRQRFWQVLFISYHQQRCSLVFGEFGDFMQLSLGLLQSIHVYRVHHINNAIRAPTVRFPQGPEFLLPTNVPKMTAYSFGRAVTQLDFFRVESYCRHSVDKLVEFQSVKDRGFPCGVQAKHHYVERLKRRYVGETVPHFELLVSRGKASAVPSALEIRPDSDWMWWSDHCSARGISLWSMSGESPQ